MKKKDSLEREKEAKIILHTGNEAQNISFWETILSDLLQEFAKVWREIPLLTDASKL